MDIVDTKTRSRMMSGIRNKDTKPELVVRRAAHALGFRFRLHRRDLPGTPDLVFPKFKVAIFVHGCFWHRHEGCSSCTTPTSNVDFWLEKFRRNQDRDRFAQAKLWEAGWKPVIVWECETRDLASLKSIIASLLNQDWRQTIPS